MGEERTVKDITLTYDDGTTEVIEKGLVTRFTERDGENVTAEFDMVSIDGKDLYMVVMAMLRLGERMGFFKG
ncbi:hypothetical protein [Anaerotignum sp. MB30-C6]|uniref:hypothetical protein n=1 Tax=Anaerotignum sp. MB30-C6 TaxID=3070814 RepID=UPI0027DB8C6B|nr:hypothetical protein [Anaerotignum sp. MB30-C6]WMI80918.1 hypothetical protein RBQ60_14025 [Anaerotignum sp. MB30-C6]